MPTSGRAPARRPLLLPLVLLIVAAAAMSIAVGASAAGGATAAGPSVKRFSLDGYVIDAQYSLRRNTGNTFEQTYKRTTVHGVPIKGPFVGTKFPVEDYVAMPIGNHELYVAWLDTNTHALLDVFVMNFDTHIVYDYAPGSLHPESSGRIVLKRTGNPVP